MQIKKILFVTRFEDLCFDALQAVLDLEKASLEHVVFMNVIERAKVERWIGSMPRKIAEGSIYPTLLIPPDRQ